jgi:hypothetical protein
MTDLKEHLGNVEKAVQKLKTKNKGKHFTSATRLLTGAPYIYGQGWGASPPGGTLDVLIGIYSPVSVSNLYVHVWVGSDIVDLTVAGPVAWKVDTRFPCLTQPGFSGLVLNPGGKDDFYFALEVPATVQRTHYLLNACLLRGVGTDWRVLDHNIVVFEVA